MKKWIIAVLMLFTSTIFVVAQQNICGTIDQTAILERLEENKRFLQQDKTLRNDDLFYVPIQFHIVTMDDGSGALGEEKILEQLCRLNVDYAPVNMKFYLKNDINYIAYTKLYEDPGHAFSSIKMSANKVNNAINVFIVEQIGSNSSGTTLGYYQPNKDWIVVIKDRVNSGTQTLSHEIGHFFTLAHTFYGWEACPYNAGDHGNPLVYTHVPCSGELIELVDQSNCSQAADRLCDTPPDYNFGLTDPEGNCSLDYEVKDFNGDVVEPMERNYMGYFFSCDDYIFTPTQIDLMRADYQSSGRNYIRSSYVPDTSLLNGTAPEIVYPEFNSTTQYYDHVLLDWYNIPDVKRYLVKVTTGFFTKITTYYTVENESKLILTNLPEDEKNIAVVIWPFNEGNSCNSQASVTHKFKTSSIPVGVEDLADSGSFKFYPSPISTKADHVVLWSDNTEKDVKIEFLDYNGRLVYRTNIDIMPGDNRIELPQNKFGSGFYVFHMITEDNSYSKKVLFSN